jgi:hypothetical protein
LNGGTGSFLLIWGAHVRNRTMPGQDIAPAEKPNGPKPNGKKPEGRIALPLQNGGGRLKRQHGGENGDGEGGEETHAEQHLIKASNRINLNSRRRRSTFA